MTIVASNSAQTVKSVARRNPRRRPTHPGVLLAETVLPALGKPKTEIARLLGLSRQSLHDILAERQPVTPATAVKLGKLRGNGPRLWLNMQVAHDLWEAEQKIDVSGIPTLEPAQSNALVIDCLKKSQSILNAANFEVEQARLPEACYPLPTSLRNAAAPMRASSVSVGPAMNSKPIW
jgi:antitoxin HigA-1